MGSHAALRLGLFALLIAAPIGGLPRCAEAQTIAQPGLRPGGRVEALSIREWFGRPPRAEVRRSWHQKKNPRLAMFSSFLVPGLGQLYNEREFWALVAAGIHFYFIGDIVVQARHANYYRRLKNEEPDNTTAQVLFLLHRDNRVQSTWLLGLTLLLSGLQSFVDAHLFDFEERAPLQLEPSLGTVNGGALRWHF